MTAHDPEQRLRKAREALAAAAPITLQKILGDQRRVSTKLQPLLRYIAAHLFEPELNVNRLKQACGIRDNSVAIQFHRETGQAPKAYISHRRLETAARLLITSRLRAWEIADVVGYSGLGVFSKAFYRWAGQRPNAYRRQIRQLDAQDPSFEVPPVELSSVGFPSTEFFGQSFLSRAVAGQLELAEAQWLVKRLMELYPKLSTANRP